MINRLRESVKKSAAHPNFVNAMSALTTPVQYLDTADFVNFLAADTKRFEEVLTKMGKIE